MIWLMGSGRWYDGIVSELFSGGRLIDIVCVVGLRESQARCVLYVRVHLRWWN
ncbi:hypothetical protein YTPLAS72_35700 [Nitrospira sp.]|nr:hypothetical protein YTPLAS72_35700 [Nitrospira sp.]